jgi:N-sulfoglucosamine sulfohydrolase
MSRSPNIFFAIADDASHFGVYGHRFVQTPHIDRLASDGVVFDNAFTSNPKCAPSRACILTGKHTWELKEGCNHFTYFPDVEVYPDILERNNYFVGFTGKPWAPGNYTKYGRKRNPVGTEFNRHRLVPPENSCISVFDYAENFREFLTKKPDNKPFCFWYGGLEPHRPYQLGEGSRLSTTKSDIETLPAYWPDVDVVRQDILDYANEIEWFDSQLGQMLTILEEHNELDNTLIIVTSDNGMPFPRVKGQMYEQDFHLPMIAAWKDHIAPGRTVSDLIGFVDIAPTFLEVAGIEKSDFMSGRSFYNVLVSPESGMIDQTRDRVWFGREKHDLGRENDLGYPVRCVRTLQYLYIRNFAPDRWPVGNPETNYPNCDDSPTKETVVNMRYDHEHHRYFDYCFGKRPAEELYDIKEDPECMRNLALNPDYDAVKNQLWTELEEFLTKTKDPRILGYGDEVFETTEWLYHKDFSWFTYLEKTLQSSD